MKTSSIPANLGYFLTVFSILTFSFGYWQEYSLNSINPPRSIIQDTFVPIFYLLRNMLFLLYVAIFAIYCIILKMVPKLSPLIYILAFMHYLMALKIAYYGGSLSWGFLEGFVGIYIIGFFSAIVVKNINIYQIRIISKAAILLTVFFALLSIDPSSFGMLARYQFHFGNPNMAGTGLVAIYCFYNIFYQPKNALERFIFVVLTLLAFVLTIMTASRTALSGLVLLFVLKSQKKISLKFVFICVFMLALVILYISISTDVWSGRDNRLVLWGKAFSASSYSIFFGSNYFSEKASFEGFFVSLPYSLGLIGLILLGFFLLQLLKEILSISKIRSSSKELQRCGHFLIVLSWMSCFESIYFGVLTPTMIIFVFVLAWIAKERKSCVTEPFSGNL